METDCNHLQTNCLWSLAHVLISLYNHVFDEPPPILACERLSLLMPNHDIIFSYITF